MSAAVGSAKTGSTASASAAPIHSYVDITDRGSGVSTLGVWLVDVMLSINLVKT